MTKWLVGSGFRLWDDQKKRIETVKVPLEYYCFLKDEAFAEPVMKIPGVLGIERVTRRDLIRDVDVKLLKVRTLGMDPIKVIRASFPAWESEVRASDDFLAATDRVPGMPWDEMPGIPAPEVFSGLDPYLASKWFRSFETPVPEYVFCALDI